MFLAWSGEYTDIKADIFFISEVYTRVNLRVYLFNEKHDFTYNSEVFLSYVSRCSKNKLPSRLYQFSFLYRNKCSSATALIEPSVYIYNNLNKTWEKGVLNLLQDTLLISVR